MRTLESTDRRKIKTIELEYSNMTFIIQVKSHFITGWNSAWSTNKYTGKIKETGEGIGVIGGRKLIKAQMELINSRPDLFLKQG